MRFASLLAGLTGCLLAAASAHAAESPLDGRPRPENPPPSASVPVKGQQQRFAKNQLGQVIELRDIDDPANPYAGKYTAWDRWHFDNYVAGVTAEEEQHFGG